MSHRDDAVKVLSHYIEMLMKKNGLRVDADTQMEMVEIVDSIIAASVERVLEILGEKNVRQRR